MTALRHFLELFHLTLPFQLSTPHGVLCHLSDKALFELEEAPFVGICLLTAIQSDQEEIGQDGRTTERLTRSASLVTCICPRCNPLLSSFIMTSTPQRHAYMLRIAPALASVRLVTMILTPFGPSLRRFLDKTIVTSPR